MILNDLEDYPKIVDKFVKETIQYIIYYYELTYDIVLEIKGMDILSQENAVIFDFLPIKQMSMNR